MTQQMPQTPGQIEYQSRGIPVPFKRWRTGAITYGVIAIVLGGLSSLMGVLIPLTLLIPNPNRPPRHAESMMGAVLLYLAIGVALIWLGIGSLRMRRWVRPLVLTIGTIIGVCGVLGIIMVGVMLPGFHDSLAKTQTTPNPAIAGMFIVMMIVVIIVMSILLIGIPAAFILFFKSPNVKAMLDFYDPTPRWTDRCPIPPLGVAVGLVLTAAMTLLAIPNAMMAAFGKLLTGPPAIALTLGVVVVLLVLARLTFRLRPGGWWGTLVLILLWAISSGITTMRRDILEQYRAAGYTKAQLIQMERFQHFGFAVFLITLPVLFLTVGYLLYVRKYFSRSPDVRSNRDLSAHGTQVDHPDTVI